MTQKSRSARAALPSRSVRAAALGDGPADHAGGGCAGLWLRRWKMMSF